ncbi:hypothetical protein NE865_13020 [Phthorimaea operculella]|nr:hypothetical protein NE865_13020 [Phthorimaea operculella]
MAEEEVIKKKNVERGYIKSSITRLSKFSKSDLSNTSREELLLKKQQLSNKFSEYEDICKELLYLNPADEENVELVETTFYATMVSILQTEVATALNGQGCSRTVQEWQYIWAQWVQKVKARARKLREQTQGTGGGPAHIRPLTDTEARVLEITGAAAVDGFAALETPLVPPPQPPQRAHSPTAEIEDDLTLPLPMLHPNALYRGQAVHLRPPCAGAGRPYPARPAPPRPH